MNEEQNLLEQLIVTETEIKECRLKTNQYRQFLLDAETELIGAKLKKSYIEESLRILRSKKVSDELNEHDIEIQEFRDKYPKLMEWIKNGREPGESI